MSAVPEGCYPDERRIPTGVAPFALISLAAAMGAGLLFMVWAVVNSSRGGGVFEFDEWFVIGFLTVPILTGLMAVIPLWTAIIVGLLARRLRSLLLRAILVGSAVLTVTSCGLSTLNVAVGPAPWLTYAGFAAIPAVALAVSAVVPWRGGFASRRYETQGAA